MTPKQVLLKIKGMQRDLSDSSFRNDYAYENKNIRITADSDNGLLSVTSEKSTKYSNTLEPIVNNIKVWLTSHDGGNTHYITITADKPVTSAVSIAFNEPSNGISYVTLSKGKTFIQSRNVDELTAIEKRYQDKLSTISDSTYKYNIEVYYINSGFQWSLETTPAAKELLGFAELENSVVLFTTQKEGNVDSILHITNTDSPYSVLYSGNLNFSLDHPIETLVDIENDNIHKVYWVDGINQPRVINIKGEIDPNDPKQFDFVQEVNGGNISVEQAETSGQFPAGVIQYAFTYFNKYGAESAIVDVSPIYYISENNKGAEPNKIVSKAFKIAFENLDTDWEYCRLYSIIRTSLNTTPEVRKVVDLKLNEASEFIDIGTSGEYIAPTDLLYKGGEVLAASTVTSKDSTLFLGDLEIKNTGTVKEVDDIKTNISVYTKTKEFSVSGIPQYEYGFNSNASSGKYYNWLSQLNHSSSKIKIFKTLETYRLGIQFQDIYGKWTNPVFVGDYKIDSFPEHSKASESENTIKVSTTIFEGNIPENISTILHEKGYNKIRPVVVYPDYNDRECICQGILCPTIFNAKDRLENGPYSQSSWFIRPFNITDTEGGLLDVYNDNTKYRKSGMWTSNSHYKNLGNIIANKTVSNNRLDNINSEFSSSFVRAFSSFSTKNELEVDPVNIGSVYTAYSFVSNGQIIPISERKYYTDGDWDIYYGNEGDGVKINFNNGIIAIAYTEDNLRPVILIHVDSRDNDGTTDLRDLIIYSSFSEDEPSYWDLVDNKMDFTYVEGIEKDTDPKSVLKNVFSEYSSKLSSEYTENIVASDYFVDNHIITIHSPEIEFDNFITDASLEKSKLRIIGIVPITASNSTYSVSGNTTTGQDYKDASPISGKGQLNTKIHSYNRSELSYRHLVNANLWHDFIYQDYIHQDAAFTIFPWNYSSLETTKGTYSIKTSLNKVRLNIYQFSDFTKYYTNIDEGNSLTHLNTDGVPVSAKVLNRDNNFTSKFNNKYYYGNIDKLEGFNTLSPVYNVVNFNNLDGQEGNITSEEDAVLGIPSVLDLNDDQLTGDLKYIPITYNSTKHIVAELPSEKNGERITETCLYYGQNNLIDQSPFWDTKNSYEIHSMQSVPKISSEYGFLFLGELYKEANSDVKFGGTSEYAIQNNLWVPCGQAVDIKENEDITVEWSEGDTYYQRYDYIKTLPRNDQDLNGITSVISFMCETRINLDGKYSERELYAENPDLITEEKFNQLNTVYSQQNNFFNYRILDSERYGFNNLPNTIAWTKTKHANAITDEWLNINLSSSIDLDGGKGKVTALKRFNDNIVAFQNKGISQVLFNSRVQITPSDNIPIEIANSGKVDGYRYISDKVGCFNKYSICESPNGIYFIDDCNKSLYAFNGELNNISDSKGFHSFMRNNCKLSIWNPTDFNNVVTYRDPINSEIMFIYKDKCLVYNETLGEFSSFYSYDKVPFVFTLNDNVILAKDGKLHIKNGGDTYGEFFGKTEDSYVEYIVNDNPTYDKIFSTLDMRADVLDPNNKLLLSSKNTLIPPFNYVKVSNEYQEAISNLEGKEFIPKFRTWRAQFPRVGKDRIRNNWIRLKIGNINRTNFNHKVRLHDVVVNYFI